MKGLWNRLLVWLRIRKPAPIAISSGPVDMASFGHLIKTLYESSTPVSFGVSIHVPFEQTVEASDREWSPAQVNRP